MLSISTSLILLVATLAQSGSNRTEIPSDQLTLRSAEGRVYNGDSLFTGTALSYYEAGTLSEMTTYVDGKKDGRTQKWFRDGRPSYVALYRSNRIEGSSISWWQDGTLRSVANFLDGKVNGVQIDWYRSGALFRERVFVAGVEEGVQRAWRENGKIYVNYEARNGRVFGLKRASLCYELSDEEIQNGE